MYRVVKGGQQIQGYVSVCVLVFMVWFVNLKGTEELTVMFKVYVYTKQYNTIIHDEDKETTCMGHLQQ